MGLERHLEPSLCHSLRTELELRHATTPGRAFAPALLYGQSLCTARRISALAPRASPPALWSRSISLAPSPTQRLPWCSGITRTLLWNRNAWAATAETWCREVRGLLPAVSRSSGRIF